jgi:adenylate cyclase
LSLSLPDLAACFEGVIPSVVAASAADGAPNIAYLSHVAMVDPQRVAISNQFFAKTAANVRANPRAALLLVDGRSGRQFALDLLWERSVDRGEVFDRIERDLRASSAQVGLGDVMRLKAIDIFKVLEIAPCPSAAPEIAGADAEGPPHPSLRELNAALATIAAQTSAEGLIDALLAAACALGAADHAMALVYEASRDRLIATGSVGYAQPGAGAEIPLGSLLIGEAAAARRILKHNDLSRVRRLASAAAEDVEREDRTRHIPLPSLPGGLSQIAVPLVAQDRLWGVLFVESPRRLAFDLEREAALEAVALQAAATLALVEAAAPEDDARAAAEPPPAPTPAAQPPGPDIRITTYGFDDSVFVNDRYVIKGVAGRLLVFLVDRALAEGRTEFSNREIRLAAELRLPDFKDNLETRLLLLRRRLEEKDVPIRLVRTDRGRMRLVLHGRPWVERRA